MQYAVVFGQWNGKHGDNAEFLPVAIVEVLNPNDVHPRPAPLFETEAEAEAYAKAEFPQWVEREHARLRDCSSEQYREHARQALRERHETVKRWRERLAAPAAAPAAS